MTLRPIVEGWIRDMLGKDIEDVIGWVRKVAPNGQLQGGQVVHTIPAASLPAHAATHQNGGSDEIDVTGLTGIPSVAGLLNEAAHDALDHTGLTGVGATEADFNDLAFDDDGNILVDDNFNPLRTE